MSTDVADGPGLEAELEMEPEANPWAETEELVGLEEGEVSNDSGAAQSSHRYLDRLGALSKPDS